MNTEYFTLIAGTPQTKALLTEQHSIHWRLGVEEKLSCAKFSRAIIMALILRHKLWVNWSCDNPDEVCVMVPGSWRHFRGTQNKEQGVI